ncbi:monooxygenase [Stachybotrys elegans]|uniref:Monooxygenase n=1 Tax=Stachybotrys elegans TaxID=80388 RepID=A0A8K0STI9_9HYPO|nr:monooxygenase [Stachybotrys elegans]
MANPDQPKTSLPALSEIEAKYDAERDKRLRDRPEGGAQFIDLTTSKDFKYLQRDPWVGPEEHTSIPPTIDITKTIKYLVVGAGYSGLLFAVRLLEAGAKPEELVMIDPAGGYGGVWYWNRYPGLMCDVESYIYMPLLEETGYMPKHKYSYGPELRGQAERIADNWGLRGRTLFRQKAKQMRWDSDKSCWAVSTEFAGDRRDLDLSLNVEYVLLAGGQLTQPKIPAVKGLETFKGHMFHTSRWDYGYTGGSMDSAKPELTNLASKRVGILGTGATAVQSIPELAKYAKHLTVFQRTPSSIDVRNQRETDPEEWKKITSQKGWWVDRNINFAKFLHRTQPEPAENMIADGWVKDNPAYCTAWGYDKAIRPDEVQQLITEMHVADIPRAERLRRRVDEIVQDKETAQGLKHWYYSWCKRPCFHDDYLPTFNRPNVTLVDTSGHGIERFTEKGLVANGVEHELDLLILATGYMVFRGATNMSPGYRFEIDITGTDGLNMDAAFAEDVQTLHGVCRSSFPNMFFAGSAQASLTANQIMSMDCFAKHVAYMIMESQRRLGTGRALIEPTQAAQEDWGNQAAAASLSMSGMVGCTPNYLNNEGDVDKLRALGPEVQAKISRAGIWGRGINHYMGALEAWREDGGLKGLDIKAVA